MNSTVFIKSYQEPEFNIKEILRYSNGGSGDNLLLDLIEECISECRKLLSYKVCYGEFPIVVTEETICLPFMTVNSHALAKNLSGCFSAVIFGATVGIGLDRLITKYGKISPARALIFQAIGAERIEALCDAFNDEVKAEKVKKGLTLKPRFSPGYGDFPLNAQKDFFRVLDCPRKIGLSLSESLLMSPSKSVTAIIGVTAPSGRAEDVINTSRTSCVGCGKIDCDFRSRK